MAEYIERTEELVLAMNAGARAIENTRRYHGAVYSKNVFSEDSQEIPYLLAAKVLREVSDAPTVDAVIVTRCEDCVHWDGDPDTYGADDGPKGKCMKSFEMMCADDFCSYGERKENNHEKV